MDEYISHTSSKPSKQNYKMFALNEKNREISKNQLIAAKIVIPRKRAILNAKMAEEIFHLNPSLNAGHAISSMYVSQRFGVSPKTIRDIWNG